jgi:hypothetical protein
MLKSNYSEPILEALLIRKSSYFGLLIYMAIPTKNLLNRDWVKCTLGKGYDKCDETMWRRRN